MSTVHEFAAARW